MKILLRGSVSDRTPEGRTLVGIARAFLAGGARVNFASGSTVDPPIPGKVAQLYANEPQPSYDLMISTDPSPPAETAQTKLLIATGLSALSNWIPGANSPGWSAVLYQDPDTAETVRTFGVENTPLLLFVAGIHADDFPWLERDWFDELTFLVDKSEQQAAYEAFDILIQKQPRLYERTNPKLAAVDLKSLTSDQLVDVFRNFNVLICTTGTSTVQQEFMATGGVVLAVAQGAHIQWLSNNYSYRYQSNLGVSDLAGELVLMIADMEQVYRRAETARHMAQGMDWARVLDKLFLNLEDMIPTGPALRNAWLRMNHER